MTDMPATREVLRRAHVRLLAVTAALRPTRLIECPPRCSEGHTYRWPCAYHEDGPREAARHVAGEWASESGPTVAGWLTAISESLDGTRWHRLNRSSQALADLIICSQCGSPMGAECIGPRLGRRRGPWCRGHTEPAQAVRSGRTTAEPPAEQRVTIRPGAFRLDPAVAESIAATGRALAAAFDPVALRHRIAEAEAAARAAAIERRP